ncbi:hypothetical protein HYC85_013792 [Camellia sinensis]|uniref:DUS-like FMN-binding domain-containing protein n=1 Tax=Camellia sinensis TaxID=4442 RepID=A0A7J7H5N5_CAMSI|nr:hypothetical protein HYC85_013792 [Camellia sinensis]
MMKSTGLILFASYTPKISVTIKSHRRLSSNIFYGNSTKARKLFAYNQKQQLNRKHVTVAARYLPPLFSVAPMMDWTDNHYRTLARLISKHAWLYTEMLAAKTIVNQKGSLVIAHSGLR